MIKKRILIIYIIGSILTSITLFVSTNEASPGSYYFSGVIFNLCTLVVFNTLFFYILHKIKLEDILKMSPLKILAISSISLVIPVIIEELGCKYFYNTVFVDSIDTNGNFSHKRVLWFEPLFIYFYAYICIFVISIIKKILRNNKQEKSGTGICHAMQGKESKTCPYDSLRKKL